MVFYALKSNVPNRSIAKESISNNKDLLRRMLEVIPHLIDIGGLLPRYGDFDEGMALQIHPYKSSRLDWLFSF